MQQPVQDRRGKNGIAKNFLQVSEWQPLCLTLEGRKEGISLPCSIMYFKRLILAILLSAVCTPQALADDVSKSWEAKYRDESVLYPLVEETIELNRDGSYKDTEHYVMEIRKKGGRDLGEITIPYDRGFQKVKGIKAFIKTPDGKRHKYTSIQDLDAYSGAAMYSDTRVRVVTMPNVVPGSVMEWQSTVWNKKSLIPGAFSFLFDCLADQIPIRKKQLALIVPKDMPLQFMNWHTAIRPEITKFKDKVRYLWTIEYADAFEPEDYMPPADDFAQCVLISNINGWETIADWYWGLVTKNLKASRAMKETVKDLIAGKVTQGEKIQAITGYIQANFRYVSMSFGSNLVEPHPSDEVFGNKYGDCKDQVLVAMAMLKEAGITAYPALFADAGGVHPANKLPMTGYFNHVILGIELEGKLFYTDLLAKGYRFDEIPIRLQGGHVFVVNGQGGRFDTVPVTPGDENGLVKASKHILKEDGSALVETTALWDIQTSVGVRDGWKNMPEDRKQKLMDALNDRLSSGGKVFEHRLENIDAPFGRIRSYIKYKTPQFAEAAGDFLTFGLGGNERDEAFTKKNRIHPLEFNVASYNQTKNVYIIPKSFEVAYVPKDIELGCEYFDYSRTYRREGQAIAETEMLRFKRARLPASAYGRLKDLETQYSRLTNEKIIIKKIGIPGEASPVVDVTGQQVMPKPLQEDQTTGLVGTTDIRK